MNVETTCVPVWVGTGSLTLQWSHVLMNVETGSCCRSSCGGSTLQWSHVLMNVETTTGPRRLARHPACFNGATSS